MIEALFRFLVSKGPKRQDEDERDAHTYNAERNRESCA